MPHSHTLQAAKTTLDEDVTYFVMVSSISKEGLGNPSSRSFQESRSQVSTLGASINPTLDLQFSPQSFYFLLSELTCKVQH